MSVDIIIDYYKYNNNNSDINFRHLKFEKSHKRLKTPDNITLIGPCDQAPVDPVAVSIAAGRGRGHTVLT